MYKIVQNKNFNTLKETNKQKINHKCIVELVAQNLVVRMREKENLRITYICVYSKNFKTKENSLTFI